MKILTTANESGQWEAKIPKGAELKETFRINDIEYRFDELNDPAEFVFKADEKILSGWSQPNSQIKIRL